jgi:ADP-ribose pyrophosphatase YjhB (NUDIX family)
MRPFNFCPACGARLDVPGAEGAARCPSCGRVWYRNPAPTVAAAIVRDARALVTIRARSPHRGKVDVPGGFLGVAEQPLDGLRRELREELGVEIDVGEDDYVQAVAHQYGDEGDWLVSMGFTARLASGEPRPADDVAEVKWIGGDDIEALEWAWEHDRALVRKALERG